MLLKRRNLFGNVAKERFCYEFSSMLDEKSPNRRILCPVCSSRVIDEGAETQTEIRIFKPADEWRADYYTRCWKCKTILGLRKLNTKT